MSNLSRANFYKPQLLSFKLQQFSQTFICWFSGSYNISRMAFLNFLPFEVLNKNFRVKQSLFKKTFSFYQTMFQSHLQLWYQKMSFLHIQMNHWIVGNVFFFTAAAPNGNNGNNGDDGVAALIILILMATAGGIFYYFYHKTPQKDNADEIKSTPKSNSEPISEKLNEATSNSNSIPNPDVDPIPFLDPLTAFFHLWPWEQWVGSLVSLILLYWITGHYYNEFLKTRTGGKWLTFQTRLLLIALDLIVNLALGLYYMQHREAFLGTIMMKCPIAISPIIFLLELITVSCYYYTLTTSSGMDVIKNCKKNLTLCYHSLLSIISFIKNNVLQVIYFIKKGHTKILDFFRVTKRSDRARTRKWYFWWLFSLLMLCLYIWWASKYTVPPFLVRTRIYFFLFILLLFLLQTLHLFMFLLTASATKWHKILDFFMIKDINKRWSLTTLYHWGLISLIILCITAFSVYFFPISPEIIILEVITIPPDIVDQIRIFSLIFSISTFVSSIIQFLWAFFKDDENSSDSWWYR